MKRHEESLRRGRGGAEEALRRAEEAMRRG